MQKVPQPLNTHDSNYAVDQVEPKFVPSAEECKSTPVKSSELQTPIGKEYNNAHPWIPIGRRKGKK